MQLSEFDFDLPEDLIAQEALPDRAASRMLFVNRTNCTFSDSEFRSIAEFLTPSDVLVFNNSKVFPARLFGKTETGATVEIFLVKEFEKDLWEILARPLRRLKVGKKIEISKALSGEVVEITSDARANIKFHAEDVSAEIDKIGKTPLPPYIKRNRGEIDRDRERYQTVFAKNRGSIAAPTAGLHFTDEILSQIKAKGIETIEVTLHVGYGTFEPIRTGDLSQHSVSPEIYELSCESEDKLNRAISAGKRIIAVGTTTTRLLESAFAAHGKFVAGAGEANITITPEKNFGVIGGLLTNFHLPKSSLFVLASSFADRDLMMNAYKYAIANRYRFYSYGDCMLIL